MKNKSAVYLILLGLMITTFFMFTGGITDQSDLNYRAPTLSNFTIGSSSPVIYARLPFKISAKNESYERKDCKKEDYYSARNLIGTLTITQGTAVIQKSDFIMLSEEGSSGEGYTGTFVDTVVMNSVGSYTATASFYDVYDTLQANTTATLTFTVGVGSEIPLSAGTYSLSTFTARCVSGANPPFTYTNTSSSNSLVINGDGLTASMGINMQFGANVLAQYPCLENSSYSYNATGGFSVVSNGSSKSFTIEYQSSAFATFNFTFDGTNLTLNYSKNGSDFELKFVKQ
ncbi:MAG: hypothetical protein EHM64_15145 [Ignavibacteriae bacterium]|nr:MAG: hypothetical protein EHM64_15145 [Ignavibacteriota bacterium]